MGTKRGAQEGRDPGGLYRGTRLGNALQWRSAGDNEAELTALEREFLDASIAAERAQRAAQEAERLRERRQNRRLRVLAATLAVVVLAALASAGIAVGQRQQAVAKSSLAQSEALAADSAAVATTNLRGADLDALAGWQTDQNHASRGALLSSETDPYLGTFPEPSTAVITALAISPDGRLLAVGDLPRLGETTAASNKNDAQSAVQLWDLANRKELAVFPDLGGDVFAVAFSPDGRTLAAVVASARGNLRLWNVATHRALTDRIPETNGISTLAYSPDGRTLALGVLLPGGGQPAPGAIDLWDPAGHRLLRRLTVGPGVINSLAFSPDGRLLASGSADDAAQLWDVATGTERAVLTGPSAPVTSVVFSPDGRRLAAASRDGATRVWGVPGGHLEGKLTVTLPAAPAIAFSAGGRYLDIGNATNNVNVWKLATLTLVRPPIRVQQRVTVMVSSPDGRTLVFGGSLGSLVALNMGQRTFYQAHGESLSAATVSRDGRTAATGSTDGTVQLWQTGDPAAARVLRERQGLVDGVAFSPDGKLLATAGGSSTMRLWNVARRKLVASADQTSPVHDLAFSPDGSVLAAAGQDAVVGLWTVPRLGLLADLTLPAPAAPANGLPLVVNEVAFGPGGHTLVAGTSYGTAQVWDLRPADEVRELCNALRGPSLARQWRQQTSAPNPCRAG